MEQLPPKSARPFHGSTGPCHTLQSIPFGRLPASTKSWKIFRLFSSTCWGVVEIRYELDVAFGSRLCENSDVELARRKFVSIALNKKRNRSGSHGRKYSS